MALAANITDEVLVSVVHRVSLVLCQPQTTCLTFFSNLVPVAESTFSHTNIVIISLG